jgi:hypothetical protein
MRKPLLQLNHNRVYYTWRWPLRLDGHASGEMKMRMLRRVICIAMLISSAMASLTMAAGNSKILGNGSDSCGAWLNERHSMIVTQHASPNLWGESQWILGFVTAVNLSLAPNIDLNEGTNSQGMMAWIDKYCSSHPSENLSAAAVNLTLELTHRAQGE